MDAGADGPYRNGNCAILECYVRQPGPWLAGEIRADRLLLVKHAKLPPGCARLQDLIAAGIVDDEFARFLRLSALPAYILGPSDHNAAVAAIREGTSVGIPVQ